MISCRTAGLESIKYKYKRDIILREPPGLCFARN